MVYKFNEYRNLNQETIKFVESQINESQFISYLDQEVISENFIENIKSVFGNFKEKVTDIFYTFLVKSYQMGFQIFDKVNTFIKWLISKINKFKEKHPLLYKAIILTVIVMILLIVTAASAKAQTSGTPIPKAKIDMAIGWLDYIKSEGKSDSMEIQKAIAHLVDLRDGKIDMPGLGQKAFDTAQAALNTSQKIMDEAKNTTDQSFLKFCIQLIEKGQSYIQAVYTKSGSSETVKLFIK